MTPRLVRSRSWEQLIPGTVSCTLSIDRNLEFAFVSGGKFAAGVSLPQGLKFGVSQNLLRVPQRAPVAQPPSPFSQLLLGVSLRSFGRRSDQLCADRQVHRCHLVGCQSLLQFVMPGGKPVDPGNNRIAERADAIDRELGLPSVVDQRRQGTFVPAVQWCSGHAQISCQCLVRSITEHDGNLVMAVAKYIRLNDHALAHGAPDGESASVNLRLDAFDQNTTSPRRLRTHEPFNLPWHTHSPDSAAPSCFSE